MLVSRSLLSPGCTVASSVTAGLVGVGFMGKVKGCNSAAFGVISLANGAVAGLRGVGSSLGMVGALLDG